MNVVTRFDRCAIDALVTLVFMTDDFNKNVLPNDKRPTRNVSYSSFAETLTLSDKHAVRYIGYVIFTFYLISTDLKFLNYYLLNYS